MTFDRKLFFSIASLFIVFIAIILLFEYRLEKENRQQSLNVLLQDYNELIYSQVKDQAIGQVSIDSVIRNITSKTLRVTIISAQSGEVILESQYDSIPDNHLNRPEIQQALRGKDGYAIRYSQTHKKNYFYSAKRCGDWVVRSSIPFERENLSILNPNKEFIYFMVGISIFAILLLYYFCRSLGKSIAALSQLAQQASRPDVFFCRRRCRRQSEAGGYSGGRKETSGGVRRDLFLSGHSDRHIGGQKTLRIRRGRNRSSVCRRILRHRLQIQLTAIRMGNE